MSVASAMSPPSHLPRSNSESTAVSHHSLFAQHQAFADRQRQLHDEERQLWRIERAELLARISKLERMVEDLGGHVDKMAFSMPDYPIQNTWGTTHHLPSGNEFWRGAGGQSNARPTRTFSEPTDAMPSGSNGARSLPPIAETPDHVQPKKNVGFDMTQTGTNQDFYVHPIPTVIHDPEKEGLDGITFKPSVLAEHDAASDGRQESEKASPKQKTQESEASLERVPTSESREPHPQIIDLPASGLTASDLLVKDAGHTPLARATDSDSPISTGLTPKASLRNPTEEGIDTAVNDEPEAINLRQPAEKSDSYFPAAGDTQPPPVKEDEVQFSDLPEDPALQGVLALDTKPGGKENDGFLAQLNSKLLEAKAQVDADGSEASITSSADQPSAESQTISQPPVQKDADEFDDAAPKLKFKRSVNFGSAFGSAKMG